MEETISKEAPSGRELDAINFVVIAIPSLRSLHGMTEGEREREQLLPHEQAFLREEGGIAKQ